MKTLARALAKIIDKEPFTKRYDNEAAFEKDIYIILKRCLHKRLGIIGEELDRAIVTHGQTEGLWKKSKQKQDVIIMDSSNTADIFIDLPGVGTIPIQLKYAKDGISSAIQANVGQCVISRLKHPAVIGVVLSRDKKKPTEKQLEKISAKGGDRLENLKRELERQGIFFLVKFI
jgi:hypothetical protein